MNYDEVYCYLVQPECASVTDQRLSCIFDDVQYDFDCGCKMLVTFEYIVEKLLWSVLGVKVTHTAHDCNMASVPER
jgi:hypothetical protein